MVGPEIKERKITMSSPAHKIRISNLSVTIWRNTNEKGSWYSVNPSRSYKKGDETWKETDAHWRDDDPGAARGAACPFALRCP